MNFLMLVIDSFKKLSALAHYCRHITKDMAEDHPTGAAPSSDQPRGNNEILGVQFGHQEVERVIQGIDAIFEFMPPEQFMSDQAASQLLCQELAYEDIPEFEDAIRGEFKDFLMLWPHLETREPLEGEEGGLRFRIKPLPPVDERIPTKYVYRITERADLWRVFLKSTTGTVIIPEMEFEIGEDGSRHVDAVYNHIAAAIWNLGAHVRQDMRDAPVDEESEKFKIMATAAALNVLLDVDQPWTLICLDPDGVSTFKPEEDAIASGKLTIILNPEPDCRIGYENEGGFVMRSGVEEEFANV